MENQEERLKIGHEIFEETERLLRELQLDADEAAEAGEEALDAHGQCVALCEEILSWKKKMESRKAERTTPFPTPEEPEAEPRSPEERLLTRMRREISARYEGEAPQEVRQWLASWQTKVEGAVLEKSLAWIRLASEEVMAWDRFWQDAAARPRSLTLWARLRAYRLAKNARQAEVRLAALTRNSASLRVRVARGLSETKVLAGMVSVFMKVAAGTTAPENRNLNRVLELERERELERQLQKRIEETKAELRQLGEQGRSIGEAARERRREHGRLEQSKNMRMLEAWTGGKSDPRGLLAQATEHQIVAAWGEVEKRIQKELALMHDAERQERQLEGEFERLMGVIREYQKATQAEASRDDPSRGTSRAAGGTAPGRRDLVRN